MHDRGNFVLLLMDFQRAMCDPQGRVGSSGLADQIAQRGTVDRAAEALRLFRSNRWPVMHVRVAFDASYSNMTSVSPRFSFFRANGMMLDGTDESQTVPPLAPAGGEPVMVKGCVNPFVGTPLREILTAQNRNHLLLGGVATNHVVESTARYAADIGFQVTVIEDLCASISAEWHDFSVKQILPAYGTVSLLAEVMATLA